MQSAGEAAKPGEGSVHRADELVQIINAYNEVTERLQRSHEQLTDEVARLHEQLASKDAQLQRSKRLAALGEMAAGIAHEIRNPLGAISLYAGMLVEDLDPLIDERSHTMVATRDLVQMFDTASRIAEAVRGLDGIVNDVLSFSREVQPRVTAVHVSTLLRRAVEAHRPALEGAKVEVQMDGGEDCGGEDMFALVDLNLMQQALLNLIRNAVEAMSGQEEARRIALGARPDEKWIRVTVRDTGPGIAEEAIERIFNPFFTTRSTGTGLGLAIVHRIVEVHNGTITVHNDGGAVFELVLPAAKAAAHVEGATLEGITS